MYKNFCTNGNNKEWKIKTSKSERALGKKSFCRSVGRPGVAGYRRDERWLLFYLLGEKCIKTFCESTRRATSEYVKFNILPGEDGIRWYVRGESARTKSACQI